MLNSGMIQPERFWKFFVEIEPSLIRYPAIEPALFRAVVEQFCNDNK